MKKRNPNLQKKKKNTSTRQSTKILSRPGSTNNPRNVKTVTSVKSSGVKNPIKTSKVSTAKKNTKTRNELIVGALKKAPLGSNKRRKLYDLIGYKQDNTTTGYKTAKSSVKSSGVKTPKIKAGKVTVAKKANVAKKVSKVAKKVSATRAKGKAALASGNKAKALRMKKREVRQTKRANRKAKRNK